MSSLNAATQGDLALGAVDASVPSFLLNRGFSATITDNGVGDLTLVMSQAQALATAGIVQVTPIGAAPAIVAVELVSGTDLRVRTFDGPVGAPPAIAAADVDYWIRVTPVSPA